MARLGLSAAHRLKVDREAKVVFDVGRDAVVANEREGEREQLPTVRRVGKRLRVAHHCGVEDHLARDRPLSTKGETFQPCAIVQHEDRLRPGQVLMDTPLFALGGAAVHTRLATRLSARKRCAVLQPPLAAELEAVEHGRCRLLRRVVRILQLLRRRRLGLLGLRHAIQRQTQGTAWRLSRRQISPIGAEYKRGNGGVIHVTRKCVEHCYFLR